MAADIAVIDILLNDVNVSNQVATRVYPLERPQKSTLPSIMVRVNTTEPNDTKDGVSTLDVEYIGVFIYGKTYASVYTLAGYVRTALDRYSGTNKTVVIQSSQYYDSSTYMEEIDNNSIYVQEDEYKIRIIR